MKLVLTLIVAVVMGIIRTMVEEKMVPDERATKTTLKFIDMFTGGAIVATAFLL